MNRVEYKNILIVEDNRELREKLEKHFSVLNDVTACGDLKSASEAVKINRFDIVLLDLILPDGSGLKLFERIAETPVVILSDMGSDGNMLEGFNAGAADYIVKPASLEIIEARMSLRLLPEKEAYISAHKLTLNSRNRTATYDNKPLELTSSEFNILLFLMSNAGTYYTANEIYEKVWKMPHLNTGTIKMHLSNLRRKMRSVAKECADLILTEFGKGYAFKGDKNE